MKKCRLSGPQALVPGELYLFHTDDPACPAEESLWAVFDRCDGSRVYVESSSEDLIAFCKWHPLPARYRYRRLATRSELRDYTTALFCAECRLHGCSCPFFSCRTCS